MQRRGDKGQPGKGRRRKTFTTKAGNRHRARASVTDLEQRLGERTRELEEAIQRQTATSEVLSIIRRSPADAQPVFEAIVQSAAHLCDAVFSVVYLYENGRLSFAATKNFTAEATSQLNEREELREINRSYVGWRAFLDRAIAHVPDVLEDPEYSREFALAGGWRAVLAVPLLHEGNSIGALSIGKAEPKAFSEQQVQLLQTFADQAVIAIENARLLNQLRESLQQQTATADVLKVISSSPGELEPVFQAMLEKAVRVCGAKFGTLMLSEGDAFRTVAFNGVPPAYAELRRREPLTHHRAGTALAHVIATKQPAQVADIQAEPAYYEDPSRVPLLKIAGARSVVAVPMVKDDGLVGAIFIYRQEVQPFTEKQIELLKNFAAQAVIAIENTRLLSELRESLQHQTATSEILASISGAITDTKPVFDAIVRNLLRLFGTCFATIQLLHDGIVEMSGVGGESGVEKLMGLYPRPLDDTTAGGQAMLSRQVVQFSPIVGNPLAPLAAQQIAREVYYNSIIAAPMIRQDKVIGAIICAHRDQRVFNEKEVALIKAFADQAVIAIENVRLFDELQGRTRELVASLDDLRTTQDRLVQTQKLALLGQLTAGIAHEIKNPLNFVNNFSSISAELIDELKDTLKGISLDDKARTDIDELTNTLKSNFDKVVHHGRRADSIVKNMLQHSREGSGEHRVIDINALVEESLNPAWHGARAETQGFEIKLKQSFDTSAGAADVFPQDIRRALLNVISNGFYAATRRGAESNGHDYEPTLTASTKNLGDRVEIRIRDNGTGMTPDAKEKMFIPFFTTKPTGEGTGLGLSISHDVIVKQHGGSIDVDTQFGEFTEIRILLPRTAALL
jgi:two-component system, NtrC family, sensor kinase